MGNDESRSLRSAGTGKLQVARRGGRESLSAPERQSSSSDLPYRANVSAISFQFAVAVLGKKSRMARSTRMDSIAAAAGCRGGTQSLFESSHR